VSGRRALALRRFKEEAVLAHVVRFPPTISMQLVSLLGHCLISVQFWWQPCKGGLVGNKVSCVVGTVCCLVGFEVLNAFVRCLPWLLTAAGFLLRKCRIHAHPLWGAVSCIALVAVPCVCTILL
jgi:hypothetical protein